MAFLTKVLKKAKKKHKSSRYLKIDKVQKVWILRYPEGTDKNDVFRKWGILAGKDQCASLSKTNWLPSHTYTRYLAVTISPSTMGM